MRQIDEIALPNCDGTHGLCAECFPGHVEREISSRVPESAEAAVVRCAAEGCEGHYSFQGAVQACGGVLDASLVQRLEEWRMDARRREPSLCNVCMPLDADTVFIACGHIGICATCAERLTQCPFCRQSSRHRKLYDPS